MSAGYLRAVLEAGAAMSGVAVHRLVGPERTDRVAHVRFAIAWAVRRRYRVSYPTIAALLGRDDHTTAGHAVRRAEAMRTSDAAFRALTDALLAGVPAHG